MDNEVQNNQVVAEEKKDTQSLAVKTPKQETPPIKETEAKEESVKEEPSNQSFWIILFFVAGVKDLLEFIFGLIPVIGPFLVWVITFFLGGLIILLLFISGNYKKLKQTQVFLTLFGQLGDLVPFLNILPLSLITIFIIYQASKSKELSMLLEKMPKTKIN